MNIGVDRIRHALADHEPQRADPEPRAVEASVALVLAGDTDLSLCFIRRALRDDDPWSGHLALPGGRADPADADARAVAERETHEEVGLALGPAHRLGGLSEVQVRSGDRRMVLSSFVYYLGPELLPLTGSDEVAEAFWLPLAYLWDPANATTMEWLRDGRPVVYPAIRCRGLAIWGLTLRVLTLFSDVLDAPLPHVEEAAGS